MRRSIKYSKLGELFCGSLEEMNAERNADEGGLACEVSEGNLKLLKDCQGHCIFAILN